MDAGTNVHMNGWMDDDKLSMEKKGKTPSTTTTCHRCRWGHAAITMLSTVNCFVFDFVLIAAMSCRV